MLCKLFGHKWGRHNFCDRCSRHKALVALVAMLAAKVQP